MIRSHNKPLGTAQKPGAPAAPKPLIDDTFAALLAGQQREQRAYLGVGMYLLQLGLVSVMEKDEKRGKGTGLYVVVESEVVEVLDPGSSVDKVGQKRSIFFNLDATYNKSGMALSSKGEGQAATLCALMLAACHIDADDLSEEERHAALARVIQLLNDPGVFTEGSEPFMVYCKAVSRTSLKGTPYTTYSFEPYSPEE